MFLITETKYDKEGKWTTFKELGHPVHKLKHGSLLNLIMTHTPSTTYLPD